ncbi:GNAT family N-acetyltransferase [Aliiroseovarius sp.]|uniref:GNAT family N-acetyltransferase n=1 Tax=Aliiroseovarius sp. TaxID=1872442 RepID=UPI003BAB6132
MTPDSLATLHAAAFTEQRPWSELVFETLLASPHVFLVTDPKGFALGRVIVDEVELLTIATAPEARRQGIGRALMTVFEAEAKGRGAVLAHLEVAADNLPAMALYLGGGWVESGRRAGYYPRSDRPAADAILMQKTLT